MDRREFLSGALALGAATITGLAACGARQDSSSNQDAADSQSVPADNDAQEKSDSTASDSEQATNRAKIFYQGHASVRITTPENKVIYVDPYAGEDEMYSVPADLILLTHEHYDHCAVERVANRADGCETITYNEAIKDGEHVTFDLGYATVTSVQAGFNELHDVSKCVGYVIELSDGTRVYLTGDTSTTDDMRDGTLANMHIDYAFWCCDGVYNMGPQEAAEAAAMVGAAHNIPYHNIPADSGQTFDRAAAESFAAPNAMVVYPGDEIEL